MPTGLSWGRGGLGLQLLKLLIERETHSLWINPELI